MHITKWVTMMIVFTICMSWTVAFAAESDTASALDAAFESGEIVFRSVGLDVNWDEVEINVPERYWELLGQFPMTDEELRTALKEDEEFETLLPSAIGPDGTMLFIGTRLALRDGQLTLLCPNPELGVPDEYGFLQAYWELPPNKQIGYYGVIWSPDGRYCMPLFDEYMLMEFMDPKLKLSGRLDPILMDTQTGDMILLEAHEPSIISIVPACFSLDGRYLYALYVDRNGKGTPRTLLKRYEIESGESELCLNTEVIPFSDQLTALPDGTLLCFGGDGYERGLARFVEADGTWRVERQELDKPMAFSMHNSSSFGVVLLGQRTMKILRRDEGYEDIEEWCIDRDTLQAVKISKADLTAIAEGGRKAEQDILNNYNAISVPTAGFSMLSPDGRYLLLDGRNATGHVALCIRLSDMKVVPVADYVEDYPLDERWISRSDTMTWHEDGMLFTGGGMGHALFVLAQE